MAYDSNNIFAKILRGELPAQKVYEDADTLAFMDIMPRCEGHTLVIPKTPARNVLDASPAQLAACMRTVQKVSAAAMKAFGAAGMEAAARLLPPGLVYYATKQTGWWPQTLATLAAMAIASVWLLRASLRHFQEDLRRFYTENHGRQR